MAKDDKHTLWSRILAHPDIVTQPAGSRRGKGWCPWHADRAGGKPSLSLDAGKLLPYCFACKRGSVFELAREWGLADDSPPEKRRIAATYDYIDADGELRYQVVRFQPTGFAQRRPDPSRPGKWIWDLKGIKRLLYRLPELRAADPNDWVFVVEGEKNVDNLAKAGLVATTNSQGVKKWNRDFSREMKGRRVVIVPDNDPEGLDHAQRVASSLHEHAAEVRVLSLQSSVPPKGDVSDYLAASGTVEDLVSLADACVTHQPPVEAAPLEPSENGDSPWPINSTNIREADAVHAALSERGFFVHDGETAYYFDRERRKLIPIDKEHRQWRVLASVAFSINAMDPFFDWLTEDLKVKAKWSGQDAVLATFAHYDPRSSTVLFDMGGGQVLKVGPDSIAKRDNGADGVLFRTMRGCDPWEYVPDAPELCTYYTLVVPANFEEVDQSVEEQRVLLFLWMLAMAFESNTMTVPIALAVGPAESGKSSLFRYIGQFLYGRDFQVRAPIHDAAWGEDDFWVTVESAPFVAYDNVDQASRWMPGALAQMATRVRRTRRQLHTTAGVYTQKIRAFLATTSRTPQWTLKQRDLVLIFHLAPIEHMRSEVEIEAEIHEQRSALFSDYARIAQRALRVDPESVQCPDPELRYPDFAKLMMRIAMGLGEHFPDLATRAIQGIEKKGGAS